MDKKQLSILIFIVILFTKVGISQNLESKIDGIYQTKIDQPGFSIAVFKNDKIIFEKQYGSANLDYNIPVTNATKFDIGSIAKQFTAAAILLLENQGKLSIKEPAYKYIDKLPRYKKGDPTIEQLLNQTSGIKEGDAYLYLSDISFNDLLTQSKVTNIILSVNELNFKPGQFFEYTNSNYVLLANIIEKVSGKSFREYLKENIFSSLKMENTVKKNSTYDIIKNRAIGYTKEDGKYYKTHLHSTIYSGDGQIMTTPRDMFKWHQGLKKAVIGTPEIWKKMHTRAKLNDGTKINYGLGVEFETHNGYEAMGFDGMIKGGFVSKYLYFPELDIAFFTTQNMFDDDFDEQFFQLVDLYIPKKQTSKNKQATKQKEIKLTTSKLKEYEGDYIFLGNEYENIRLNTIKLKGEKLVLKLKDGKEIGELTPLGENRFVMSNIIFEFDIKANNKSIKVYANENEKPWLFNEFKPYKHSIKQLKEIEGIYINKDIQVIKEIKLTGNKLEFIFGKGSYKNEMKSLSKDQFSIPNYSIKTVRNEFGKIVAIKIMGLVFEKLE